MNKAAERGEGGQETEAGSVFLRDQAAPAEGARLREAIGEDRARARRIDPDGDGAVATDGAETRSEGVV